MPDIGLLDPPILIASRPGVPRRHFRQRAALLAIVILAAVAGFVVTPHGPQAAAVAAAGPELTHLLRAMAAMKMMAAAGLVAAIVWRLARPASASRLVPYMLVCACMAAGPGLIWSMAYLKLGALLLHAGLLAGVLLLWRDPQTSALLDAAIVRRRLRHTVGLR